MKKTPALCAGFIVIFFLTGCSGQVSGAAATSPPSPSSTRHPSASQSASPSPEMPGPAESEPVGAAECDGDNLDISIAAQPMASGAGSFYSEITFTNTSGDTCLVEGPLSIFNLADSATGAVVGKRAEDNGLPEVVPIAPGASAYSTIHFTNAGAYDCETAVADVAYVSPPNWDSSRTITLESPVTVCNTPATYSVSWISATSLF
ncbi:DUF4232 domain-containing protein [Cryobacterium sp. PH29-G1]|uniref:DUF4232 domain-containing protein n=1 Tax=Cryobacterium sp. PH29-G1 TaxID=3046211 RepID=UPI0024B8B257|nr:DUF4232 domain-containing protein [Cryobacterium sp. PH29-G1]MDJ0348004.1 DUF4232 domain-containing protein [Cryobacterium sp. PH29-G1]